MMENFYITTAIDYVNGAPHIGHAFEKIYTDILFRHFKKRDNSCFFLTGTDEHGIKIQKTAIKPATQLRVFFDIFKFMGQTFHVFSIDFNLFIWYPTIMKQLYC